MSLKNEMRGRPRKQHDPEKEYLRELWRKNSETYYEKNRIMILNKAKVKYWSKKFGMMEKEV